MLIEKKTRQVNVRLSEPVFKRLKLISSAEDVKITDLIRRALRKTYGLKK
jgi:predicted DNA binding CopG/RHH family protein